MTLWATRARLKEVEKGEFACPHCKRQRLYRYFHVPTYFTLLNIPLFKNGMVADYVECSCCKRQFAPAGVNLTPPEKIFSQLRATQARRPAADGRLKELSSFPRSG